MRVVRLLLLGLIAFAVTVVVFFPAAPVIEKIKPELRPLQLSGVSGPLLRGNVASVVSTDDLLPLELQDVQWRFAPTKLFTGTGAAVAFSGLGGGGTGDVIRTWGGDLAIDNVEVDITASELEVFLPVPIAQFAGKIRAEFAEARLVNQQLTRLLGDLNWSGANIKTNVLGPELDIALGTLNIDIDPEDNGAHKAAIAANGGDITADGEVNVQANGDFELNIVLTPTSNTPPELVEHMKRTTRAESGGRYRWQEAGNINRLQ